MSALSPEELRTLCYDAALAAFHRSALELGAGDDIIAITRFLVARAAELNDDRRLRAILHYGAGAGVEAYWQNGVEVVAYLFDGTEPKSAPVGSA